MSQICTCSSAEKAQIAHHNFWVTLIITLELLLIRHTTWKRLTFIEIMLKCLRIHFFLPKMIVSGASDAKPNISLWECNVEADNSTAIQFVWTSKRPQQTLDFLEWASPSQLPILSCREHVIACLRWESSSQRECGWGYGIIIIHLLYRNFPHALPLTMMQTLPDISGSQQPSSFLSRGLSMTWHLSHCWLVEGEEVL